MRRQNELCTGKSQTFSQEGDFLSSSHTRHRWLSVGTSADLDGQLASSHTLGVSQSQGVKQEHYFNTQQVDMVKAKLY